MTDRDDFRGGYPAQAPRPDAAVVLREDFKPDVKAARETSLEVRLMMATNEVVEAAQWLQRSETRLKEARDNVAKIVREAVRGVPPNSTGEGT